MDYSSDSDDMPPLVADYSSDEDDRNPIISSGVAMTPGFLNKPSMTGKNGKSSNEVTQGTATIHNASSSVAAPVALGGTNEKKKSKKKRKKQKQNKVKPITREDVLSLDSGSDDGTDAEDLHHRDMAAVRIQKVLRGRRVFKEHCAVLSERRSDRHSVTERWGTLCDRLRKFRVPAPFSWLDEKMEWDMVLSNKELEELLGAEAVKERMELHHFVNKRDHVVLDKNIDHDMTACESRGGGAVVNGEADGGTGVPESPVLCTDDKIMLTHTDGGDSIITGVEDEDYDTDEEIYTHDQDDEDGDGGMGFELVEISDSVRRWLQKAESTFTGQFWRRMTQLAAGGNTYALKKRLKGSTHPIYESKLNRGDRILWTELVRRGEGRTVLVSVVPYLLLTWKVKHVEICMQKTRRLYVKERHCVVMLDGGNVS